MAAGAPGTSPSSVILKFNSSREKEEFEKKAYKVSQKLGKYVTLEQALHYMVFTGIE